MKLTWKEPPKQKGGTGRNSIITPELVAALKHRQGTWARIVGPRKNRGLHAQAWQWRKRFPVLELVTRSEPEGYCVYARYIGNGKPKESQ